MKILKFVTAAIAAALIVSCSDAQQASITSMGKPHKIVCYNFSQVIFEGRTNGQVSDSNHMISFENSDGKYVEIYLGQSATCIATTI